MKRSDYDAIQRASVAFQRSVLASLGPKADPEAKARAWPGTKHIEAAVDAYLQQTSPVMSEQAHDLTREYYYSARGVEAAIREDGEAGYAASSRLRAAFTALQDYIATLETRL